MGVIDHTPNVWQIGRLRALQRGPTPGHYDVRNARTGDAAYRAAGVRGSFGCDGAGIDHSQVRICSQRNDLVPGGAELPADSLDLRLIEAAADGVQIDLHRITTSNV